MNSGVANERPRDRHALLLANRGYVLENGRIVLEGSGAELLADQRLKKAYLGL